MMHPLVNDLDHVLDYVSWDELRGSRLFITGGTGFFGTWLLETFAWANDRLGLNAKATVLTRSPDRFREKAPHLAAHPRIDFLMGELTTFDFPSGQFSHVIHAATESATRLNEDYPLRMIDTLVGGTRRVLEFAQRGGGWQVPAGQLGGGIREAASCSATSSRKIIMVDPILRTLLLRTLKGNVWPSCCARSTRSGTTSKRASLAVSHL